MAELLCKQDPARYEQYLQYDRRKNEHYMDVQLSKAVYGTVQAALRFYEDLSGFLESEGFVVNPYDFCVFNKMINDKQCTILFHVDDLKISHTSDDTISEIIKKLSTRFGKLAPLTVTRGKVHKYLGMTLDYRVDGKVKVIITDNVDEILKDAPQELLKPSRDQARTPAGKDLFDVDENSEKLDDDKSEKFHSITYKLLFISKRGRPDIQVAVGFLCTRVNTSTIQDWKKLSRILRYLQNTRDLYLTLDVDDLCIFTWYVDASYNVHVDSKGHSGWAGFFGGGVLMCSSKKQSITSGSSTESELIAISDGLKDITWAYYFMEEQGYDMSPSVIFQDNESTIKLAKNGRRSSNRTKHINNRFFRIHDKFKNDEIDLHYCASEGMWADGLTKPLQGKAFIEFRNNLLNTGH